MQVTRHHPTGKFRVNANGKLLDVWLLISCELCDRTSKIPIHERSRLQALKSERLLKAIDAKAREDFTFFITNPTAVTRPAADREASTLS